MTGLNPKIDRILEIASIITDKNLNILAKGPNIPLYHNKTVLKNMHSLTYSIHQKNGLIKEIKKSKYVEKDAERKTIKFLKKWVKIYTSPICGNSISQDRNFLKKFMPKLESYFHYRNIDVSTIKELVQRWNPTLINQIKKKNIHRALPDIYESIKELLFYKKFFSIN
ncbi:oligoribonuclease [Buchnera aphidicola (Cinara tujafilina)]|uniref:Oligoribonuclease n=1 Tax=Buchnera aphidicola (Cinara tujafilina) TaxID=261317 RepID=F7WZR6_9GAMM|nr:oligoribonuclease [Buchnera aphidicola (Cinara tujafilina)]